MLLNSLSLTQRLLFAVSIVLTAFLGLSAFSLNNAFQASTDSAIKKRLENDVYTILAAAEFQEDGQVKMPDTLAIPDFSIPNSGLYAQITSGRDIIWQSHSLLGQFIALPEHPGPSQSHYSIVTLSSGVQLMNLAYGVVWENSTGKKFAYTINVSEDLNIVNQQKVRFQHSLWYWLGGTGVILLILQVVILRWSLQPLHEVTLDLHAIETGDRRRLSEDYPPELRQLTQNINTLLEHEQSRRERYKNSLADLAHSLKTPLAVIRGELEKGPDNPQLFPITQEQLNRVTELVDYQLQRAATEGQSRFQTPISLDDIAQKIIHSLDKVYQHKQITTQREITQTVFIHADEGDMYELLGNLLENAYKYCIQRVAIYIQHDEHSIKIIIDDDGKGIPDTIKANILHRGQRIDTQIEGHGLGLAIVSDIVDAYQGEINITHSHLGGARFSITLPRQ